MRVLIDFWCRAWLCVLYEKWWWRMKLLAAGVRGRTYDIRCCVVVDPKHKQSTSQTSTSTRIETNTHTNAFEWRNRIVPKTIWFHSNCTWNSFDTLFVELTHLIWSVLCTFRKFYFLLLFPLRARRVCLFVYISSTRYQNISKGWWVCVRATVRYLVTQRLTEDIFRNVYACHARWVRYSCTTVSHIQILYSICCAHWLNGCLLGASFISLNKISINVWSAFQLKCLLSKFKIIYGSRMRTLFHWPPLDSHCIKI